MVMPRAFSSGALSIWSYAVNVAPPVSASTFVIAAVSDVLPWSTWPIVPTLQCGLFRSNFAFAMFFQSYDQLKRPLGHSNFSSFQPSRAPGNHPGNHDDSSG